MSQKRDMGHPAAEYIAGLQPYAVWRGGLVLLGSVVYALSMWAGAYELGRFAGVDDGGGRLFRLVWIPYVAAGVFACGTATLNRTMGHGAALGFAVASTFGAGTGLLFLPKMCAGWRRGGVRRVAMFGGALGGEWRRRWWFWVLWCFLGRAWSDCLDG